MLPDDEGPMWADDYGYFAGLLQNGSERDAR